MLWPIERKPFSLWRLLKSLIKTLLILNALWQAGSASGYWPGSQYAPIAQVDGMGNPRLSARQASYLPYAALSAYARLPAQHDKNTSYGGYISDGNLSTFQIEQKAVRVTETKSLSASLQLFLVQNNLTAWRVPVVGRGSGVVVVMAGVPVNIHPDCDMMGELLDRLNSNKYSAFIAWARFSLTPVEAMPNVYWARGRLPDPLLGVYCAKRFDPEERRRNYENDDAALSRIYGPQPWSIYDYPRKAWRLSQLKYYAQRVPAIDPVLLQALPANPGEELYVLLPQGLELRYQPL
jgi:hypothetical protein